jgi:hypothetical protein
LGTRISDGLGFGTVSMPAYRYLHGWGIVKLMDMDLDMVLQYPFKPAPLPSLGPTLLYLIDENGKFVLFKKIVEHFNLHHWDD